MNKIKKLISVICCVSLILTMCFNTYAYTESVASTDSTDSYQYTDSQNNIVKLVRETDDTITVYVNGKLDHSAKTDLKNDTIEYIKYDNSDKGNKYKKNVVEENKNINVIKSKETLKASALVKEIPSEILEDSKSQNTQSLQNSMVRAAAYEPFPYWEGWSYVTTYTHYDIYPNNPCEGYKKKGGTTQYSEKKISFVRSMAIGVGASLLLALFTGGITLPVAIAAIVGCAGAFVIDGKFTQDLDVYAHYEIQWENWLARINNRNFYTNQGTYYIVMLEPNTHKTSTTLANGMGKAGFIWDMNEFLRSTILTEDWF